MTDTFERLKRLRKLLRNLDDEDLRVLDTARSTLASAVANEGADSIFGEDISAELTESAHRGIREVLSGKDIESIREDFWEYARRLGFGREDEHWDYRDASPPPELLKRLIEMKASIAYQCVDLMVADDLVKVWVDIDIDGYVEGQSTPKKLHPEGYYYVAEHRVLRMQIKEGEYEPVVVADWYAIAVCHLSDEGTVVVEPVSYGLYIEGKPCHLIGGEAARVLEKFKLEDPELPMVAPTKVEETLGKGPYR